MTSSSLGWCFAGIQFNQFRNSEEDAGLLAEWMHCRTLFQ